MNNNDVEFLTNYRFKDEWHNKGYWQSEVVAGGCRKIVVDAAGMNADRQNVLRLVPYGHGIRELDSYMRDGDLCAYFTPPQHIRLPPQIGAIQQMNLDQVKGILKGRASHAELGYLSSEGRARQISLWNQEGLIQPEDRDFHVRATGTDVDDIVNIYRLSLSGYGIDEEREKNLKAEVKRWKEMVRPVRFPCATMDIDPADFASWDDLKEIALKLINHSPDDPHEPLPFLFNCVQWSTLVFSLAICFPLSADMLELIGAKDAYERNWAERLGYAQSGLKGLEELPVPFYTVQEIVENVSDMYFPDLRSIILEKLSCAAVVQVISNLGGIDCLRVMPNALVIENRLRAMGFARKTKTEVEYVCTAAPMTMLRAKG